MNKEIGNVQLMQKINRLKVLNYVRRNPDVVRPVISKETGLSLASITNITSYLLEVELLSESGRVDVDRVGRKSTMLRFCASSYNLICVVLGKNFINVAYTDLEGKIIDIARIDSSSLSPDAIMTAVRKNVSELLSIHGKERVLGIGVAISGLVLDNSRFVFSTSHKWKEFNVKKILEEDTALPVFIDNVSLLKAVWYFCCSGAAEEKNMIFIDMDSGIGAAQFFDGSMSHAMLGEFGHTTVEKDGAPCFCGNRGCLEAMCSPIRMLSLYESASGIKAGSIQELDELYRSGDKSAVFAVSECGKYLGIGLANLVNLFNPSVFVINIGDFAECPALLEEAKKELYKRASLTSMHKVKFEEIQESEENTICGTAFNLCDRLFDKSFPRL